MTNQPKRKSVSWRFPETHIEAINQLRDIGYSDDGFPTQIAALRKAIEDAWAKKMGDTPFPTDDSE